MKQIANVTKAAEGLSVRGRQTERNFKSPGRSRSKSKVKRKFCNSCKKKGHVIDECYKLQNKNRNKGNASSSQYHTDVAEDDIGDLLVMTDNVKASSPEWILDMGCTYYMCPNHDWFSTYDHARGQFGLGMITYARLQVKVMSKSRCLMGSSGLWVMSDIYPSLKGT